MVINVDDVNDERPQFSQKVYIFRVWENELPGTNVIHLKSLPVLYCSYESAVDADNAASDYRKHVRHSLLSVTAVYFSVL